ncbi:hypothetical protein DS885_06325 [Psychromonas sp. B3M02]|uniref:hypothetical protein n=1 Tax=Psychromonas sp. B3M02 TaxID=2267226 RepID=UPI000DEA0F48|nr:hypothetical protein [Psychromonas sp. B3M02]RBW46814.1 hypothetical protein DS885_06325 [Psychromonas sp. B3M02]
MKFAKIIMLNFALLTLSGCVGGLTERQEREYAAFENDGVLVEEKTPTLGAVLGILPGAGSFYTGNPGRGITNLLLWPFSILWEPVNGWNGARKINYDMTAYRLKKQHEEELLILEFQYKNGEMDNNEYFFKLQRLTQKYQYQY